MSSATGICSVILWKEGSNVKERSRGEKGILSSWGWMDRIGWQGHGSLQAVAACRISIHFAYGVQVTGETACKKGMYKALLMPVVAPRQRVQKGKEQEIDSTYSVSRRVLISMVFNVLQLTSAASAVLARGVQCQHPSIYPSIFFLTPHGLPSCISISDSLTTWYFCIAGLQVLKFRVVASHSHAATAPQPCRNHSLNE